VPASGGGMGDPPGFSAMLWARNDPSDTQIVARRKETAMAVAGRRSDIDQFLLRVLRLRSKYCRRIAQPGLSSITYS
jgi:hypothetical protein